MNFIQFLPIFLFLLRDCYAFTEPLYEGSSCEVEGKPGVCKVLVECPAEYHRVIIDNMPAKTRCSFKNLMEVVCCEIQQASPSASAIEARIKSSETICSFNGTLPVRCCVSDEIYTAPLQDPACPAPPPLEYTDNLIKRKCLEYSQYSNPCLQRRSGNQFERQHVCFQDKVGDRITGGTPAQLFEFPHMVMLGYKEGESDVWQNGGTLISERAVLTAAHAVFVKKYGGVKQVCLGLHYRKRACRSELRYYVRKIVPHSEYQPTINYHDIAILHLSGIVTLNEYVRPACLPFTNFKSPMTRLVVTGWGLTSSNGTESSKLLKTTIDEFRKTVCVQKYPLGDSSFPKGWQPELQLCAGSYEEPADSCQGDSGGPLQMTINSVPCSYVVVGVVSSGPIDCGVIESPGIYTRVARYTDWIVQEIWPRG